jgi:hypothetical protein
MIYSQQNLDALMQQSWKMKIPLHSILINDQHTFPVFASKNNVIVYPFFLALAEGPKQGA